MTREEQLEMQAWAHKVGQDLLRNNPEFVAEMSRRVEEGLRAADLERRRRERRHGLILAYGIIAFVVIGNIVQAWIYLKHFTS